MEAEFILAAPKNLSAILEMAWPQLSKRWAYLEKSKVVVVANAEKRRYEFKYPNCPDALTFLPFNAAEVKATEAFIIARDAEWVEYMAQRGGVSTSYNGVGLHADADNYWE